MGRSGTSPSGGCGARAAFLALGHGHSTRLALAVSRPGRLLRRPRAGAGWKGEDGAAPPASPGRRQATCSPPPTPSRRRTACAWGSRTARAWRRASWGATPRGPRAAQGRGAAQPLAHAPPAQVGHLVLALGRPGRTVRATLGMVSAQGEGWRTHAGGRVDRYLETDADLPRGFCGGALVDAQGRLLGHADRGLLAARRRRAPRGDAGPRGAGAAAARRRAPRLPRAWAPTRCACRPRMRARGARGGAHPPLGGARRAPRTARGCCWATCCSSLDGQPLRGRARTCSATSATSAWARSVPPQLLRAGELREVALAVGKRP